MSEPGNAGAQISTSERLAHAVTHPAWHGFDEIPAEVLNDPETIFLNLSGGWQQVPDEIRRAGMNAVEEGYLKIQPVPEFNQAVADKFRNDFNVDVDPKSEVISCNGAGDGLLAALSVLLNPGDEVITFDPGYTLSYLIPAYLSATVRTVPLSGSGGWSADADTMEAHLDRLLTPRTRAFIIVNPDNPTGHVFRRDFLERLGKRLCRHGIPVVEDQVYEKVVYPPHQFVSMVTIPEMRDLTVCVSSFAKSYLCAGMKVGYIAAPSEIIRALRHYYMLSSFTPNTAALRTGIDILRGPQDFLNRWIGDWDEMRQKTTAALNSIPGVACKLPEAGTYCLADISGLGSGEHIAKLLMDRARVLVTPGNYYGPSGDKYIRVCYGRSRPDRVEQGLERVVDTLKVLKSGN
ncbi:MAG: pyridoxal phosphate-dependent aminotransferase [Gammaproteobacteria bacterium]|nr:pyridoxal phosphate-dependent aminotransferase [Gammaproteobacteria bacterium]